ncbi:MAG: glycosyltransferase family 2 protein [Alphaproteobacteria bacterium]|nr:glycosyltransferase family 2 protein [Alphaproteobacteria bacterium]
MSQPPPPLISIVMPAHHAHATLSAAIESVRAQTHPHWELWVVDDASADGTRELIRSWMRRDPRIRGVFRPRNGGPAAARNDGLARARGEYIAFLDADDLWHPDKLQSQWQAMAQGQWAISYCASERFEDRPPYRTQLACPTKRIGLPDLLARNSIVLSGAMVRRSILGQLRFPAVRHEDYVYWYQALRQVGQAHLVPSGEPLVRYRLGAQSVSGNKLRAAWWHWRNLRHDFGLPLAQASWCFARYAWQSLARAWQFRRLSPVATPKTSAEVR